LRIFVLCLASFSPPLIAWCGAVAQAAVASGEEKIILTLVPCAAGNHPRSCCRSRILEIAGLARIPKCGSQKLETHTRPAPQGPHKTWQDLSRIPETALSAAQQRQAICQSGSPKSATRDTRFIQWSALCRENKLRPQFVGRRSLREDLLATPGLGGRVEGRGHVFGVVRELERVRRQQDLTVPKTRVMAPREAATELS